MNPGNPINRLAKGSFFLILDNLTNLGIGAIFWLVLAKITEPTIIGQAMVVTGFAITIIGFTGHGVRAALSKYVAEYNAKDMPNVARRIMKNGIRASLIMSGIMAVVISLLSQSISTMAYQDPSLALLLVFTISTYLPTWTVVAALQGSFQGAHFSKFVTIVDLTFQLSRMAFVLFALYVGMDVFGILLGFSLASFVSLAIAYFFLMPRAIAKSAEHEDFSESSGQIVRFTGLNYFSVGIKILSAQLGVLILGTQSFEFAAFYGLALLISKIVGSFSHSVGEALLPTASAEWVNGNKSILGKMVNTSVRISILISGFGFILLMIDPAYFLSLISESYIEAAWALRILAASAIIVAISSILTSLLNATNRPADVAKLALVSSLSTIILTLILVPLQGLEGAAIAMFVGSLLSLSLTLIVLKQKENIMISSRSIIKPFIAIISGLIVGYIFVLWNQVLLGIVLAIMCYGFFVIIYRVTTKSEIKRLMGIVIRKRE
jgi:stage V sporulation protein B